MGTPGVLFLIFQAIIWIGPPLYAGYAKAPLWFVLVWSATLGASNVITGWRYPGRGVFPSLLHGTIYGACAVVPLYLIGLGLEWLFSK
jgi:hypothetical protein